MLPILDYSPATYEAILAVVIVVGLIQSVVLRRKAQQVRDTKSTLRNVVKAATAALLEMMVKSSAEIARVTRRAEEAERLAMEVAADADDAREDDLRASDPLAALLSETINRAFPGTGRRIDPFSELTRPIPNVSLDEIKSALAGDASAIERRLGASPGSIMVEVYGSDGRPVPDSERADVLQALRDGNANLGVPLRTSAVAVDIDEDRKADVTTINEHGHGLEDEARSTQAPVERRVPRFGHGPFDYQSPRAG